MRSEAAGNDKAKPEPAEKNPISHRDDYNASRHPQSHSNSSAPPNAHVVRAPGPALFIVEKEKHGDYKLGDVVGYLARHSGSERRPGEIRFIGRVKDDRDGTVYVGLDMFDFAYNRDDYTFDGFPQFEPRNMKPGCAVYCNIRDISALEDVPMEVAGEDGRRQQRKGSDSRILQQTVNTETIKEEPSSEEIPPHLEDWGLYGAGVSSHPRQTPEKRDSHQRPNNIEIREKRSLQKDLSQVKRVSQYTGLEENAMVQTTGKKTLYAVIRWMGYLPGRPAPPEPPLVGVEMEEGSYTERKTSGQQQYGVYDGYQLFECKSGRGAFYNANRLLKDQRFQEVETAETSELSQNSGGQMANFEPYHELLECSVCLERFTYPKVLPCQHTFCLNCLRGIGKGAKTVTCPQCREVHPIPENGMANLKDNFVIKNLLGIVDESPACFDCGQETSLSKCKHCKESVCGDCRATHACRATRTDNIVTETN